MSRISNKKVHSFFLCTKRVVLNFGKFKSRKCSISFSRDYACQGQKNKKTLKIKAFRGYIFFIALFGLRGWDLFAHSRRVSFSAPNTVWLESLPLGLHRFLIATPWLFCGANPLPPAACGRREWWFEFRSRNQKEKVARCATFSFWLRGWDLNLTTSGL